MKFRSGLFLFVVCLGLVGQSWAQEEPSASVEVEVDRSEITIGDRIKYRMKIEYDPGVEIQKPGWGEGLESRGGGGTGRRSGGREGRRRVLLPAAPWRNRREKGSPVAWR